MVGVEAGELVGGQIIHGVRGGGERACWKSSHEGRKSRALSPHLLAVRSVLLLCCASPETWAPNLLTQC